MEDSYLTQPWVFEMQEGENISLLCVGGYSFVFHQRYEMEMGYPLLRRCFMRECIAGFCTGLARGGKKALLLASARPVRCIAGQNWWLESVARIGGQNQWPELVARNGG